MAGKTKTHTTKEGDSRHERETRPTQKQKQSNATHNS